LNLKEVLKKVKYQIIKIFGSGSTGSIFKNMSILASGSIISKLIGFASYPIITRIYSPADFGVLAVFSSTIFILLPFSTLRYSFAIPLPKNDILAFNLLSTGFIIAIVLGSLLALFFVISGNFIFNLLNIVEISEYWWLLILAIMGAALYELLTNWASRKLKFGAIAKTGVWRSSISVIIQIVLGLTGYKSMGLVIGETAHKMGGGISLLRIFIKDILKNISTLSIKYQFFLLKYYKNFPLFNMPSDLLLVFTSKVPILYFAYQFGPDYSGQLGLALMIISVPLQLFGKTASLAYYAEIARIGIREKKQVFAVTKSVLYKLIIFNLFTFIILLFSPSTFSFAFGSKWIQAGEFTRILSIYLLLEFITTPLTKLFLLYNKQSKYLKTSIYRTGLVISSFYISYSLSYDPYQTLSIYTVFMCVHFFLLSYQIYKIIK